MSCPDWNALREARDDEPRAWQAALEHQDHCRECRESALAEDPLLLFRQLPADELRRDEIDDLHQGIRTLRRAQAIARPTSSRLPWAAAAAAVLLMTLLSGVPTSPPPLAPSSPVAAGQEEAPLALALADMPVIEDVETAGSLVQVDGSDLTLVLVQRASPPDA